MSIMLNIIVVLLLVFLVILLGLIILPIRYSFYGGYNNNIYCFGIITLLQFFKISVSYNTNCISAKINLFGFSVNIDPETPKKKKAKTKKDKPEKKAQDREKHSQDNGSFGLFKELFKMDIIFHVLYLLRDLVAILKPKVLMLKGKIGFYEPHHTAWMLALLSPLSASNSNSNIDIQPVWDDEYLETELVIKGHIAILAALGRILKFLLSKNTLKVWRIIKSEKKKKKIMKHAT